MLTLRRSLIGLSLSAIFFAGPPNIDAAPVSAGDYIRFQDGPGTTGGGEFWITGTGIDAFITFCLQRTEYMNFSDPFLVDNISTYAISDPVSSGGNALGRDYLSAHTAFLYTQFRKGTLTDYDYAGPNRWQSANKLQNAIWMFEQEIAMNSSNPYVVLATNAVNSGAWSGLGNVRVLNLSLRGTESQDQLVITPEPASLLLFGVSLMAVGMARSRGRRRVSRVLHSRTS